MNITQRLVIASALALGPLPVLAQATSAPQDILPPEPAAPPPVQAPVIQAPPPPAAQSRLATPLPPVIRIMEWSLADARALLAVVSGIEAEGLLPADYREDDLRKAIAAGEGLALNEVASTSFSWLAEDLRDGRTPMSARRQWFVVDPDADLMPTDDLMERALKTHDVPGVLARLAPLHPDYALLKAELARTPKADTKRRALVRANLDRWRWLPRDLGKQYLLTNVPEFQLRLTVNDRIIRSYRTIVGKPGRTATPQLAETIEGIIFNPTWTVPQSIVKGEGLGARLLANPARARAQGYRVTRGADGFVTVVQQPGPNNSLGLMKLDMPNPHAIFLHDTPHRELFGSNARALSHGCVRVERASELAITLAILQAGLAPEQGVEHTKSGVYTRVPFTKTMPVYITYFTIASDIGSKLSTFSDLYGRDAPVLASFDQPRVQYRARATSEEVVAIEAPGA